MRKAILALALLGLANPGGVALAAADPATATFQNEVCSVFSAPANWETANDPATFKRAEALSMSYERGWTPVRLGWKPGRFTCRKPKRGVDYLRVTSDRDFAAFGRWTDTGAIDCYYERQDGQWRRVACLEVLVVVN